MVSSVRYSLNRKKEFQIKTSIFEENGVLAVRKEAYSKNSINHIKNIYKNYEILKSSSFKLAKPKLEKSSILFPFIEGRSLDSILIQHIMEKNIKEFIDQLIWYKSTLMKEDVINFYETNTFVEVFGKGLPLHETVALKIPNIDLSFDNLIFEPSNGLTVIDYEWVFNFPIPLEYVLYRAINAFVEKYSNYLINLFTIKDIFGFLELDYEKVDIYRAMENSFMDYVGSDISKYKGNYLKPSMSINDINSSQSIISNLNNQVDFLHAFWEEQVLDTENIIVDIVRFNLNEDFKVFDLKINPENLGRIKIEPGYQSALIEIKHIDLYSLELNTGLKHHLKTISVENDYKDLELGSSIIKLMAEDTLKLISVNNNPVFYINDIPNLGGNALFIKVCMKMNNYITTNLVTDIITNQNVINMIHSKTGILNKLEELQEENKNLSHCISDYREKNSDLSISISNYQGEVESLKEKEQLLLNILSSDGWKLLLKYYKLRDKIVPSTGKSRLFLKLFKKIIINKNFKLLNRENVKKFIYYSKNQNFSMLESRVDDYIERNTADSSELKLSITENVQEYHPISFEKYSAPTVSIVIPVYNQWDYTYSCLKSILANTDQVTYEIIIADDMSSDETTRISEYVENIKLVRDGENRGFLLNCNNATKCAEGKYILFLNNDTQVQAGWLDSLVELIESDQQIGMVGSKLVYPDGRLQEAGGIIWNDASGWNFGRLDDPAKPEYNYVKEVDYISGAAIMIKTDLWQDIGGFDERYVPAYFEDSDLAFEVRKHGYKVMLQPKSVVVHFEGISHGKDVNEGVKRYQELNKLKFVEKWSSELSSNHFKNGENVFKARDRSKDKKTIVVIDHYVPHFDKDAGSRTTYQYLKLFVEMGLNVKFIGDNFYKHEPYTSELEKLGIEVLYSPYNNKNIVEWVKNNREVIDYAYINRPHISIKYIDMLKKYTNAKVIYYGHDLHFLREYREYELTGNESLKKSAEEWKKTEFTLYEKSDVVYYPSDVEVNEIKKYYPNINAKAIPAYIFDRKEINEQVQFDSREGLLFVGGFNHKPNMDAVLWFVSSVYPEIIKKSPELKFYIVGSNPPKEITSLASKNIIVTGFVSDEELIELYNKCRLVVVPLRYGAGVKGKVIEALYNQVPVVTTTVGAEGIQEVGNILTIADSESDFADKVLDLYDDVERLQVLSAASLDYVNRHFTTEAVEKIISTDIRN